MMRVLAFIAMCFWLPSSALAQEGQFVPLTNSPLTEDFVNTNTLADLFNNLFMLAIGAGAAIAVFQIIRAGVLWGTAGGNESNVRKARDIIRNSIFGLILLLSPVIVFGIINRDILSLEINGLGDLRQVGEGGVANTTDIIGGSGGTSNPAGDVIENEPVGGAFFYVFESYSEAQADTYVTACKSVPEEASTLIAKREATKKVVRPSSENVPAGKEYADLYRVYCESTSKAVGLYKFWRRGGETPDTWTSFSRFGNVVKEIGDTCNANGGTLGRDYESRGCSDEEKEEINERIQGGAGDPENFLSTCTSVIYSCKAD